MTKCTCGAEPFQPCGCFTAYPKPGKKKKRSKTPEEAAHLNWIASLPCSIKGCPRPSNCHHIRKYGEPKDHFKSIPLCHHHHQGKEGIHDGLGKKRWEKRYGLEMDYLKQIQEMEK